MRPPKEDTSPWLPYLRQWSVNVWLFVALFCTLRMVTFVLAWHGTYHVLEMDYSRAEQRIALSRDPRNGYMHRVAYSNEVQDAEVLVTVPRWQRALLTEWDHAYICGTQTCFEFVFGDLTMGTILFYLSIAITITLVIMRIVRDAHGALFYSSSSSSSASSLSLSSATPSTETH